MAQNGQGGPPEASDAALWAEGLELVLPTVAATDPDFWDLWNPEGVLPVAYIIDQRGVITWRDAGDSGGLPTMQAKIETLLRP